MSEIQAAYQFVSSRLPSTPLIRYGGPHVNQIFLKCENLQPVGSFKLRGSLFAISKISKQVRKQGVWTASAGNMGIALAYAARKEGVPCLVVVLDDAPVIKVRAIQAEGADVIPVPFEVYQQIQNEKSWAWQKRKAPQPVQQGTLIHPFADLAMLAGNGMLAMELLDQIPEIDVIVAPYGGGGLTCGMASAAAVLPGKVKVIASEVETGAPLTACLAAGKQVRVPYRSSFISGMGAPFVFDDMWPLAKYLLDKTIVVNVAEVVEAVRLLAVHNRLVVEGAAGTALAAALKLSYEYRRIAVILSGGNLDAETFSAILRGEVPGESEEGC
jgi:threonine dehydratase